MAKTQETSIRKRLIDIPVGGSEQFAKKHYSYLSSMIYRLNMEKGGRLLLSSKQDAAMATVTRER